MLELRFCKKILKRSYYNVYPKRTSEKIVQVDFTSAHEGAFLLQNCNVRPGLAYDNLFIWFTENFGVPSLELSIRCNYFVDNMRLEHFNVLVTLCSVIFSNFFFKIVILAFFLVYIIHLYMICRFHYYFQNFDMLGTDGNLFNFLSF